jgi:UDP-N-acetylmuramate: L-alanyl-gamma-D-glutamyl-meso-diaminopimelate ligase
MIDLDPNLNRVPQQIIHIHIMGICGTGMAALAGMLQQSGYTVTGSDDHVYPPMSGFLINLGITISEGYSGKNLTPRPDLVIVGNVITRKNPEAAALAETDIPYLSFPQALSHFYISPLTSLVVCGTHGKTTICSLLATALYRVGLDPTFMIGGIVSEFNSNFRLGSGPYFVAEGDEYDTAFFDKEPKFLHYQPRIAIITSIEFDHADIYPDLDSIKRAFGKFVRLLPEDGLLIANLDDPDVAEIASAAPCPVEGYGTNPAHTWSLDQCCYSDGKTAFTVCHHGEHWAEISVAMQGEHNCLNSLAVCALMNHIGIQADDIDRGLGSFGGVKRRQEVRAVENGITVIDDFAHHPTAVRETVRALRQGYKERRLIVVFEPRTNSSRRAIFQQDYVLSFDPADIILLREPVPLTDFKQEELFSSALLAADLREKRGLSALAFSTTGEILDHLTTLLKTGDVVAVLSNGGFDNIHTRLIAQISKGNNID